MWPKWTHIKDFFGKKNNFRIKKSFISTFESYFVTKANYVVASVVAKKSKPFINGKLEVYYY